MDLDLDGLTSLLPRPLIVGRLWLLVPRRPVICVECVRRSIWFGLRFDQGRGTWTFRQLLLLAEERRAIAARLRSYVILAYIGPRPGPGNAHRTLHRLKLARWRLTGKQNTEAIESIESIEIESIDRCSTQHPHPPTSVPVTDRLTHTCASASINDCLLLFDNLCPQFTYPNLPLSIHYPTIHPIINHLVSADRSR